MRAAFYESDITPPLGCYMWGYYTRRVAKDVFQRLYAKAFVCECDGKVAAVVSVDTCTLPREMHGIVCKRIEEYTGIKPENVVITANHTHRGAPVFSSPELDMYADKAYTDVFFRLVADSVILAYKRLDDAALSYATIDVDDITFNRDAIYDDGKLYIGSRNPRVVKILGTTDPELSVVKVEKDGKLLGAIINYPLHQDSAGGVNGYTGDFASSISDELKKEYGNDFVSLFVIGTCGDINHVNNDLSVELPDDWNYHCHMKIGKTIAEHAKLAFEKAVPIEGGISCIKEKVTFKKRLADKSSPEAFKNQLMKLFDNNVVELSVRNFIFYYSTNETETEDLYIQTIRIGDMAIYALPGELYVNYGLDIKAKSPTKKNIIIENSNDYCGYIPSREAFAENSLLYETMLSYDSCLVPETGDEVVAKALEQANKLFNK